MSLISHHFAQEVAASSVTVWNADMCSLNATHGISDNTSLIDLSVPGNRLYQKPNGDICLAEKSFLEIGSDFFGKKTSALYHTGANVVQAVSHFFSTCGEAISSALSFPVVAAISLPGLAAEEIPATPTTATNEQALCEQAKRAAQEAQQKQEAAEAEKRRVAEEQQRQAAQRAAMHQAVQRQQAQQELFWAQYHADQARARGSSGVHEQISLDFAKTHARNAGLIVY